MTKLSAWLSIGVGLVLGAAQLFRNFDNWERVLSWGVDVFAGLVMVVAGLLALRKRTTRLLAVGWAFGIGLYVSALVSHVSALGFAESAELYVLHQRLAMIIAGLLALSLIGLAMVLFDRKNAS